MGNNKNSIIDILLPNCFFGSAFFSMVLVVVSFGNIDEKIRIIISAIANGIVLLILAYNFIKTIKNGGRIKYKVIALMPIIFLSGLYVINIVRSNNKVHSMFELIIMLLFALQYVLVAIYIVDNDQKKLWKSFDYYSVVFFLFSVIYITRFFVADGNFLNSIAGMSYMTISYAYLVIVIVFCIDFIYFDSNNKIKGIRFFAIVLFWLTMIYSGTRGPIACIIAFAILIVIYDVFFNKRRKTKLILLLTMIFIGIYVFSVCFWSPAKSGSATRLQNFNYDKEIYEEQKSITVENTNENVSNTINFQEEYVNYIINSEQNIEQSMVELSQNRNRNGEKIFDTNNKTLEDSFKNYELYQGRSILQEYAIGEFKKSPIFGNGAMYFQQKYSNYPHSIIYELLSDFGIVGLIIYLGAFIVLFLLNIKSALKNKFIICVVILSISMCVGFLFSGSIYSGGSLMFLFTYALYNYLVNEKGIKKNEN